MRILQFSIRTLGPQLAITAADERHLSFFGQPQGDKCGPRLAVGDEVTCVF